MSIKNFPDLQVVGTIGSNEAISLGGFTPTDPMELQYIRVLLYISNITPSNEGIRLYISSDVEGTRRLYNSNTVQLSNIEDLTSDAYVSNPNWMGLLRFDFNRQGWPPGLEYYLNVETFNYTRTATEYISTIKDYPLPRNSSAATSFTTAAYAVEIFGFED